MPRWHAIWSYNIPYLYMSVHWPFTVTVVAKNSHIPQYTRLYYWICNPLIQNVQLCILKQGWRARSWYLTHFHTLYALFRVLQLSVPGASVHGSRSGLWFNKSHHQPLNIPHRFGFRGKSFFLIIFPSPNSRLVLFMLPENPCWRCLRNSLKLNKQHAGRECVCPFMLSVYGM